MAACRKIDKEGRIFNREWNLRYFVNLHTNKSSAICVICNVVINVLKEYNIRRHYTTRHNAYEKYEGRERQEKYAALTRNLAAQQYQFSRYNEVSEKATKVSLVISDAIGRRQLPYSHGEFAKEVRRPRRLFS